MLLLKGGLLKMAKKKVNFEDALSRLESIVDELEGEEVSLEKSIALYKEGIELSLGCKNILKTAETEISILQKNDKDEFEEIPFDLMED